MHKLTIQLKQHTPIIHFQHDQVGATLRATEVKPKLDRFILEKLGGSDFEIGRLKAKVNNWLVGNGDHPALNYKLKIIEDIDKQESLKIEAKTNFPCFFGDMGNDYLGKEKKLLFNKTLLKIEITCLLNDLKETVNTSVTQFFKETTFGTRQSKGFGYYQVFDKESNDIVTFEKKPNSYFDVDFRGIFDNNTWIEFHYLFNHINYFYKSLRSGINEVRPGGSVFYMKSIIFHYAKNIANRQWEKKTIKQNFVDKNILKKQIVEHNNADILTYETNDTEKLDFKDLFGLATKEEWQYYRFTIDKHHAKKEEANGFAIIDEKDTAHIARFKSPISFFPIKMQNSLYRVYVLFNEINPAMRNQYFQFNKKGETINLKIPNIEEFYFVKFLKYIKDNYDFSSEVANEFRNKKPQKVKFNGNDYEVAYYKMLSNIYTNFKKNISL